MQLTQKIKEKALELGFDKIGISNPTAQPDNLEYFDEWLGKGKNGSMRWMERRTDERKDINKYYPQVRSVITVAINYFTGTSTELVNGGKKDFKFSSYAWGVDYHIIVKEKLKLLLEYIEYDLDQDTNAVICVDSSPIMEKLWAKQAGIGWQGKNTLLINEDLGSWLLLGELLLDLELEYDEPFIEDLCGSCTACIDACTVNALSEYKIDASKCISYLTVEFKDKFTDDVNLNGWIYGCDTCQQVCPWNKKNQTFAKEKTFLPSNAIKGFSLVEWYSIKESNFKRIFNNSPVKRIKHQRFLRNIKAVKDTRNVVD